MRIAKQLPEQREDYRKVLTAEAGGFDYAILDSLPSLLALYRDQGLRIKTRTLQQGLRIKTRTLQ